MFYFINALLLVDKVLIIYHLPAGLPVVFSFFSFLTSIFVTKTPLHAYGWNFLSMGNGFGLLFHVLKHFNTDYQNNISYLLLHLFPCAYDSNSKAVMFVTVPVPAI